jgi:hypothetical protein
VGREGRVVLRDVKHSWWEMFVCWIKTGHRYKFSHNRRVTMYYQCELCDHIKLEYYFQGYSE